MARRSRPSSIRPAAVETAEGTKSSEARARPYLRSDRRRGGQRRRSTAASRPAIAGTRNGRRSASEHARAKPAGRRRRAQRGCPAGEQRTGDAADPSGRVDQLAIGLGGPEIKVEGPTIRQVMRAHLGRATQSTAFDLIATVADHRVTRLVVDGMGAGHGVGFCQWGAVGRARAGQSSEQILAAYFPGTRLERRY